MGQNNKRGFSLIELVLVIGIIAVIASFTLPNLFGRKSVTELTNTVNQISVTLREAQSRAISQNGGVEWGVRFDNSDPPYFAMFSTPNYSSSTRVIYSALPQGVDYTSSTLAAGGYTDVAFSQITGRPNKDLYLSLYLIRDPQVTLVVNVLKSSGQVTVLTKEILIASLYGSLQDVLGLVKVAQQNSIDGVNNEVWGVHFQNPTSAAPYAELFYGTYSPATVTKHLDLLPGVDYGPASIPEGSSLNVTFSSNGNPSQAVTITTYLISYPTVSTFVQINNSGICAEGSCADTTPPTVAISSPTNGATVSGNITLSGTASDNIGLSRVEIQIDGGVAQNALGTTSWSLSLDTLSLSNTSHSILARAVDTSNNTFAQAISVIVSNVAPPPPPPAPGCFTYDTLVDTPSGPRAIGTLGVGDTVYAYDETTGETVESQITQVLVHPDNSYGVVTFSDGTSLEVTSVHRFYNPLTKKWLPIGEMKLGDSVLRGIGPDAHPIVIRSMEFTSGRGTVYNIEVNRYHTYYVNGILVHNRKQL